MARVFVITGPSGVGKGTLIGGLMERVPRLQLSVSATTRAPRPGERDGLDYHFMSDEDVENLMKDARLIRHLGKLKAVHANAGALCDLLAERKTNFGTFLAEWPGAEITKLWDTLAKRFSLIGENRLRMELRAEAFNIFNHTNLSDPNTDLTSPQVGQITGIFAPVATMRRFQFAVRLDF